jgi:hypothetical protein
MQFSKRDMAIGLKLPIFSSSALDERVVSVTHQPL